MQVEVDAAVCRISALPWTTTAAPGDIHLQQRKTNQPHAVQLAVQLAVAMQFSKYAVFDAGSRRVP